MGRQKTYKGYMRDFKKFSKSFQNKTPKKTNQLEIYQDKSPKHFPITKNNALKIYEYNRDMSPYQFEEFMADLFRKMGYKKVKVTNYSRDKGKDIIMEEEIRGKRRLVIVECKFQKALVGRPVIQKLHSALVMHKYSGKKRGIIVTTGKFSNETKNYAEEIKDRGEKVIEIELINKQKLNQLIEKYGKGIFKDKGKIKINVSFPYSNREKIISILKENCIRKVKKLKEEDIKINSISLCLIPSFFVEYKIEKEFKTSIGIIYNVNKQDVIFLDCSDGIQIEQEISNILGDKRKEIEKVVGVKMKIEKPSLSELKLKTICLNKIISNNSKKVGYYGRNNSYYEKECELSRKDIDILNINSANIPFWSFDLSIGNKNFFVRFFEGEYNTFERINSIKCSVCKDCEELYFCKKCKGILCFEHIYFCKKCGKPVCKNCSVDKRKFLFFISHFCSKKCLEGYRRR